MVYETMSRLERFPIYEEYNDLQSPKSNDVLEGYTLDRFHAGCSTAYLIRTVDNKKYILIYYTLNEDSFYFVDHLNGVEVISEDDVDDIEEVWKKLKEEAKKIARRVWKIKQEVF